VVRHEKDHLYRWLGGIFPPNTITEGWVDYHQHASLLDVRAI
jgi:hypothetical protein